MYRRTWVLESDKLHDGAQPVAIEVAKARLIGRPGIQCFKLQRRRRWLPGCPGRVDRYEPRGDRAGGAETGHLRSLHHSGPARESVGPYADSPSAVSIDCSRSTLIWVAKRAGRSIAGRRLLVTYRERRRRIGARAKSGIPRFGCRHQSMGHESTTSRKPVCGKELTGNRLHLYNVRRHEPYDSSAFATKSRLRSERLTMRWQHLLTQRGVSTNAK
jgi:hypothetical protein